MNARVWLGEGCARHRSEGQPERVTDMRKGFASLAARAEQTLQQGDLIKIIWWVSHCRATGPSDNGARGCLPVLQAA